jgi:hypothetical protein
MRRLSAFIFISTLCVAATSVHAQVVPSAYRGQMQLTAGGIASAFQPDYAGGGVPAASPQRLYGFGAYVDLDLKRWVGVEAEGRWLRENNFVGITEDNYLIGPRVRIYEFHKLHATPYGKVLIGIGHMNFEYNEAYGRFSDLALGGGIDLKLTRRISVRPADFEYQLWPNWINGTLKPYGLSAGVAYRIF